MTDLEYESAYLLGGMVACKKLYEWMKKSLKTKSEKIYRDAEFRLFTSSKDNMYRFLASNGQDIAYRNFVRDRKGRLVKCEAVFVNP